MMCCTRLIRPSWFRICRLISLLIGVLLCGQPGVLHAQTFGPKGSAYYTEAPLFIPYPNDTGKSAWTIEHLGPVGLSLSLEPTGFTMRIRGVEPGSPAAATGKLEKGQVIERINGNLLKGIDPRVLLGNWITEAEATDGRFRLAIQGKGEVVVQLPVLGRYSPTWPRDCEKSDRIVRQLADLLATHEKPKWGSVLFLLSTGEEKDLAVVRRWMANFEAIGAYPWHKGMVGPGICEYYLRTGDQRVLPIIERGAEELAAMMYTGGWSGRGHAQISYSVGSGQLNAAGVPACAFLLLAKQCGVKVDPYTLRKALVQFYRFAGHDNVGYGEGFPEGGFRDNGKTAALAVAMQAAARLTPEGEASVYARARDISAAKSFYASTWFMHGHTGGGIGELWHNIGMGLVADKKPAQYRSFLDERRWNMELSRRFDGSIGISGGDRYDVSASERTDMTWGTYYALTYTQHRKKLQLFGAPKTPWCKSFSLPARPWGTEADEAFLSLEPAVPPEGPVQDMAAERIRTHASLVYLERAADSKIPDEEMMSFLHHPDSGVRTLAMRNTVAQGRRHLILPCLRSKDPRVRHTGLLALTGMFKGRAIGTNEITPEMITAVEGMLTDPDESTWVMLHAAQALERMPKEVIRRHKDRLLALLKHEDWWVRESVVRALSPLAGDGSLYREILPPVAKEMSQLEVYTSMLRFLDRKSSLVKAIQGGSAEVKAFAAQQFAEAHAAVPPLMQAPGGHIVNRGASALRRLLGEATRNLQGGAAPVKPGKMVTAKYRVKSDPAHLFPFDGSFAPNRNVLGSWEFVTLVKSMDELKKPLKKGALPKKGKGSGVAPKLVFGDRGKVVGDGVEAIWTGKAFIHVLEREACRMGVIRNGGRVYLVIENGGFDPGGVKPDWHPGYLVYGRGR